MLDFRNYWTKSKYSDDAKKLVIGKLKNLLDLGQRCIRFWWTTIMNIKKQKVYKQKYKDVLLNNKYLRYSMNRIQSKSHRIRTYEINIISLSCFDDKIYIQNDGCDGLALGY